MQIKWQISKKRGNYRPSLNYSLILEPFEKNLAVHAVQIRTQIPEIPNPHHSYCMPGENERHPDWQPGGFHYFSVPYFKRGESHGFIRLPFRESNGYPEVEASFKELRKQYESVVQDAYGRPPIDVSAEMDISTDTRTAIAANIVADKLVGLFGAVK